MKRFPLALIAALTLPLLPARAADPVRQVIALTAISNRQVVAMFSPAAAAASEDRTAYYRDFTDRSIEKAVKVAQRRRRDSDPQWQTSTESVAVPDRPTGGMMELPEGMDPPTAMPDRNAILVHGTVEAIDQFREVLALLDAPAKMVNVECKLVDAPTSVVDEWGLDFGVQSGQAGTGTGGNTPANGIVLRYARANARILAGIGHSQTGGLLVTAPNATTTSNIPVILSIGQTLPYFSSEVSYDDFGNRHVETFANAVFTGVELYVRPRINGDNSVTMDIQPTYTEAAGRVFGPNGISIPITQTVGTRTQITVASGESLIIGGTNRGGDTVTSSLLGSRRARERSNPTLIVTPKVLPPAIRPGEEVWH